METPAPATIAALVFLVVAACLGVVLGVWTHRLRQRRRAELVSEETTPIQGASEPPLRVALNDEFHQVQLCDTMDVTRIARNNATNEVRDVKRLKNSIKHQLSMV